LGQSAIQFCLKKPQIVSVLPNFTNMDELNEYTAAVDTPAITDAEQEYLDELWDNAFYLVEPEPEFREI
jgi:aryl-alcohol dehydrogenase-like predicted oxidoreductase